MRSFPLLLALLAALSLGFAAPALAQSGPESGVDVLDRERRQAPSAPLSRPRPTVTRGERDEPVYDPGARLILASIVVEGATAFSSEELVAPYASLMGQSVGFADVNRVAQEMTVRYREAGYILSQVVLPPQSVSPDGAEIVLTAIEGFVSDVLWQGEEEIVEKASRYFSSSKEKLLAMRPLRLGALERAMHILQDAPGLAASSTFDRSEVQGASVLVISVKRDIAGGSFSAGNTGTESSGPVLLSGSFFFGGYPALGFQTTIGYTQAWDYKEYYSLSLAQKYQLPSGLSLSASYAFAESQRPGTEFAKLFDHATLSHTLSVGAAYPVIRGRNMNLSLGLNYNLRNSRAELLGSPFTRDRLRSLSFDANFDFSDESGGVTQITLTLTAGLKAFGATHLDPESSSPMAPADYSRLNLYAYREQRLPLGFSLTAAGEIQLAGTILPSYEQFSLGGQLFGRGYDSGTLESDNGAGGYLELRRAFRLSDNCVLTPYAFIDGGAVWTKGRAQGVDPHSELSSAGLGLSFSARADGRPDPSLNFFVGKPLKTIDGETSTRWVLTFSLRF
ncbi:MAG: hypothetical protein LBE49_08730 [Deltaproteobacteria bacterium]|nr:hypothetical protein [Deltaproteobacteria bacterium]